MSPGFWGTQDNQLKPVTLFALEPGRLSYFGIFASIKPRFLICVNIQREGKWAPVD